MRKCVLYFLIVCLIDILTMVSPQMMNFMIGYVEHNVMAEDNPDIEKEPEWRAYFYPALILVATMLNTIILSQYFESLIFAFVFQVLENYLVRFDWIFSTLCHVSHISISWYGHHDSGTSPICHR